MALLSAKQKHPKECKPYFILHAKVLPDSSKASHPLPYDSFLLFSNHPDNYPMVSEHKQKRKHLYINHFHIHDQMVDGFLEK